MDELLDVVDGSDNVIQQLERSEVHKRGLLHRGAFVLVLSPLGFVYTQVRAGRYPGSLDIVSEHVKSGEGYLEAARRGLKEDLVFSTPRPMWCGVLVGVLKRFGYTRKNISRNCFANGQRPSRHGAFLPCDTIIGWNPSSRL